MNVRINKLQKLEDALFKHMLNAVDRGNMGDRREWGGIVDNIYIGTIGDLSDRGGRGLH